MPFWLTFPTFLASFSTICRYCFLDDFSMPFFTDFDRKRGPILWAGASILRPFFRPRFWHSFLSDFGSFWSLFRAILKPFLSHFDAIFGTFLCRVRSTLGKLWHHDFLLILHRFWIHFNSVLGSELPHVVFKISFNILF